MTDITVPRGASAAQPAIAAPSLTAGIRLAQIDMLRGLVIVLMALDHVRDYFHAGAFAFDPLDPDRTNAALYATRWITHLCAPTFVFLSGVSAFLQMAKGKSAPDLARFLLTRGLWLVALEATVISFGWSFAAPYPFFLQVIWAIGWSMIALAALVLLPRTAVLAIGAAIVAGHNLLDPLTPQQFGSFALAWTFLHEGGPLEIGGTPVGMVMYPILPWAGVMALGYGLGGLFLEPAPKRNRTLLQLSGAMIALFAVLRGFNLYGNPTPWEAQGDLLRSAMAFMDVEKYPPSLMYVLATLGVGFALLRVLDSFQPAQPLEHGGGGLARFRAAVGGVLLTFGAVPFFFYVLHIYLVHALAIAANAATGRDASGLFNYLLNTFTAPEKVAHLGFPLAGAYLAWMVALALLYPACRWWARVKRTRRDWWLSYL
jgi:uncharacterized membrane protein